MGLPVGVQECGRQFVPKWDSPSGEIVLATAGTTSLMV